MSVWVWRFCLRCGVWLPEEEAVKLYGLIGLEEAEGYAEIKLTVDEAQAPKDWAEAKELLKKLVETMEKGE